MRCRVEPTRDPGATQPRVTKNRDRPPVQEFHPEVSWVPGVWTDAFKAEASRQSALVAAILHETADQAFVDAASAGVWDDE